LPPYLNIKSLNPFAWLIMIIIIIIILYWFLDVWFGICIVMVSWLKRCKDYFCNKGFEKLFQWTRIALKFQNSLHNEMVFSISTFSQSLHCIVLVCLSLPQFVLPAFVYKYSPRLTPKKQTIRRVSRRRV